MIFTYRQGTGADARAISELVNALAEPFFVNKDKVGAAAFLDSISQASEQQYLEDKRYWFWLAETAGSLSAFIGVRDSSHIFHLFVDPVCQNSGLGSSLIQAAERHVKEIGKASKITVNAALTAQGFYRKNGFRADSDIHTSNGVTYLPMGKQV